MRLARLKLITVSVVFLLGSQASNVLAEIGATTQQASDATAASTATATQQVPQVYRGYPPPPHYYRGYRRGWSKPFGNDGPRFRGPWKKGRDHSRGV